MQYEIWIHNGSPFSLFTEHPRSEDSIHLEKLIKATKKHDLTIALIEEGHWQGGPTFYVLVKKDNKWDQFYLETISKDSFWTPKKVRRFNHKTSGKLDDIVWNELQKNHLLTMNPRALDSFVQITYFDTVICAYYTLVGITLMTEQHGLLSLKPKPDCAFC